MEEEEKNNHQTKHSKTNKQTNPPTTNQNLQATLISVWKAVLQKYTNFSDLYIKITKPCLWYLTAAVLCAYKKHKDIIWILPHMVFTKSLTDFNVFSINTEKTAEYPIEVFILSYSQHILHSGFLIFMSIIWVPWAIHSTLQYWDLLRCGVGESRPYKSKGMLLAW